MTTRDERIRRTLGRSAPPASAEAFSASLKRRQQAAQGLERDLLTEVPLLYGSPDNADPGIVLAKVHREELLRRNGGGILSRSRKRSEVALPFERAMIALAFLLSLAFFFVD